MIGPHLSTYPRAIGVRVDEAHGGCQRLAPGLLGPERVGGTLTPGPLTSGQFAGRACTRAARLVVRTPSVPAGGPHAGSVPIVARLDAAGHDAAGRHPVTQARTLAVFRLGLIWAGSVPLPGIARTLPGPARGERAERRLRRFVANPRVDPRRVWAPLVRGLPPRVVGPGQAVALVCDPTPHRGHATVLLRSVVRHKRALPVSWRVVPQQAAWPRTLASVFAELAAEVAAALPPGTTVTRLADRGLVGPTLVDGCRAAGWHLVLRLTAGPAEAAMIRCPGAAETTRGLRGRAGDRTGAAVGGTGRRPEGRGGAPGLRDHPLGAGRRRAVGPLSDRAGGDAWVREDHRRACVEATCQDGTGRPEPGRPESGRPPGARSGPARPAAAGRRAGHLVAARARGAGRPRRAAPPLRPGRPPRPQPDPARPRPPARPPRRGLQPRPRRPHALPTRPQRPRLPMVGVKLSGSEPPAPLPLGEGNVGGFLCPWKRGDRPYSLSSSWRRMTL